MNWNEENVISSSTEENEENERRIPHFPVVAIIGAGVGILVPIAGMICGIIALVNSIRQKGIDRSAKISNILFASILVFVCFLTQTINMMNAVDSIISDLSTSSSEELLHLFFPLLF